MPLGIGRDLLRDALQTLRGGWRRVLAVEIVFKLIGWVLGAAGSAAVLAWVQLRSGGGAVTNTDLVRFLTRPASIVLLLLIAVVATSLALIEQAVLLRVLGGTLRGPVRERLRAAAVTIGSVVRLAAVCVGVFVAVIGVAAALLGATHKALLAGTDINYYLSAKPPVFFVAAAIGGVVALAAGGVLGILFVRWLLALCITVFEGVRRPRQALAESATRVRGNFRGIAFLLLAWHGTLALVSIGVFAGFRPLAARALEASGTTSKALVTIVLLLTLHSLGTAAASILSAVGHALIVLHVYRETHPARSRAPEALPAVDAAHEPPPGTVVPAPGGALLTGPAALGAAVALLVAAFVVPACVLVSRLGGQDSVEITAHRGASHVAPENTLSAVRGAIEAGADWAEIDVQETRDGSVVVLHDQDLMRLAGDPRRIADLSFEDARKIDVGTKFDPRFAGEGLPTLEETIALARGKIRLNIELKYYGEGDPRLARDVARILRNEKFDKDCIVASLNFGSLAEARAEWPALRTAAIVTARVGDPTRLDVDILSVGARLVNMRFLRTAHLRGKEILVWTIDDPKLARRLMDLGVDNVITNDPAVMVKLRDERAALTRVERLVLAFRVLLGAGDEPQEKDLSASKDL